jgi:hypothetical protein
MTALTTQEIKVASVMQRWAELLPFEPPDAYLVNRLVFQHNVETVMYAVQEIALKRVKMNGQMERPYALRLFGAVCCSVTRAKKQHRLEPRN